MPAAAVPVKKPKGTIMLRPRNSNIALAPCKIGWSNLTEAEAPPFAPTKPRFNAKFHISDPVFARNVEIIGKAVAKLMPLFEEECRNFKDRKSNKAQPYELPSKEVDVPGWLTGKLKEAGEKSQDKDPTLTLSLNHRKGVSKKTGQPWESKPMAWDGKNNILPLKTLRLGSGSVVQPIVNIGLFVAANQPEPALTVELVGVRVLKLVQYQGSGGGATKLGEVADEDLALLGDDADIEDLSSFLGNSLGEDTAPAPDDDDAEEAPPL